MEITSLNRLRGALKAKVKKVELFRTGSEQSPSSLEVKLQLNNISALRDKIDCIRKDYYSLPADVDLSETDNELELLEDRLDKTEGPLQGIKVQRFALIENYKSLELHGFSDASEKAFGAAIYLR
ncbi:hypothetical protein TNCT_474811 [Trichonephila clavata]|uniref:Uncharacterized protein n=1 Tax=Trichonephila clavata TaxID=2740835 RepID=A0A8X6HLC0_TRICU|nr:hypothetical protein TNCT_474811 [Trichonephila clavata]